MLAPAFDTHSLFSHPLGYGDRCRSPSCGLRCRSRHLFGAVIERLHFRHHILRLERPAPVVARNIFEVEAPYLFALPGPRLESLHDYRFLHSRGKCDLPYIGVATVINDPTRWSPPHLPAPVASAVSIWW